MFISLATPPMFDMFHCGRNRQKGRRAELGAGVQSWQPDGYERCAQGIG